MVSLDSMGNDIYYTTAKKKKKSHKKLLAKSGNILGYATKFVLYTILLSHLPSPGIIGMSPRYMATVSLNEKQYQYLGRN